MRPYIDTEENDFTLNPFYEHGTKGFMLAFKCYGKENVLISCLHTIQAPTFLDLPTMI